MSSNVIVSKTSLNTKSTSVDRSITCSVEERISFTESLRDQMEAGKSVVEAVRLYGQTCRKPKLVAAFKDITLQIDRGMYTSNALALYPRLFGYEYCALIGAAERSGNWTKRRGHDQNANEGILDLIIKYLKRSDTARQKVQSGLIYPAIVVLFVLVALVIFGLYVIPAFKEIFTALEAPPSIFTAILFGTADFVTEHYFAIPIALLAGITGVIGFWRAKGHELWQRYQIRLKGIAPLFINLILSETFWLLGILYSAGLPTQECLSITAQACRNKEVARAIGRAINYIHRGETFAEAMRKCHFVFDGDAYQVMVSAEEAGSMDTTFKSYAERLSQKVDTLVDGLLKLIEPLTLAILGLVVGVLAASFYGSLSQLVGKLANH